jgi:hypothetical protein
MAWKKFPTFFPAVGELENLIDSIKNGGVDKRQSASLAWESVYKMIAKVGSYGNPEFNIATTRTIKSLGGWRHLCSLSSDELNTWTRKRFEEDYQTYVEIEQKDNLLTEKAREELRDG